MQEIIGACHICGNESSYDEESYKSSIYNINGINILLCCPCEDDLFLTFLKPRISKKRMLQLTENLMSEEKEEILSLYEEEAD